jgi:uncharacterized protein
MIARAVPEMKNAARVLGMISSRIRAWFVCAALVVAVLCGTMAMYAQSAPAAAPESPAQAGPPQFFMRLVPPRPTFANDMTPQEQALMEQHAAYWAEQFKTGKVLILGPVLDPKGAFGIFVVECSEAEARAMADGDPTVKVGLNKIEIAPMHVFLRKKD